MRAIVIELLHPHHQTVLQKWQFDNTKLTISVGRCEGNDIVLPSNLVSRQHIKLTAAGVHWKIGNFGKNGCYVNDRKVEAALLHSGIFSVRLGKKGPHLRINVINNTRSNARPKSPQPQSRLSERQITKKGIYVSESVREFAARRSMTLTAEGTLEKLPDGSIPVPASRAA